jgi:hypothetical protein
MESADRPDRRRLNPNVGDVHMARSQSPVANPPVTFTPEQLQAVIAKAIAEHEAAKAQRAKTDTSDKYTALTISAFKRAGFKPEDIKPRTNVLTFNKWLEKGFRPKEGEKAVAIKGLRLFHETQVRPLTEADHELIVDKINRGVPVAVPQSKPAKAASKAKPVPINAQA